MERSDAYRIDLYRDYGILPDGIYRITKTFQQKGASGTVQKEHSAVFAGREYRFEKADWSDLLAQPEGRLSETAISRLNSLFAAFPDTIENYNPNVLYCFFTSEYSRPEEMNLPEFLRYYPQFTALGEWTPELKEKFENSKFWKEYREEGWTVDSFMVPVHLYRPEVLEESLQYYTGIGLSELDAGAGRDDGWQPYVEEIDRYVTFTSDAAGDRFKVTEGKKEGKIVTLTGEALIWKRDGSGENSFVTETAVLILQEKNGRYLIRSFLPADGR